MWFEPSNRADVLCAASRLSCFVELECPHVERLGGCVALVWLAELLDRMLSSS